LKIGGTKRPNASRPVATSGTTAKAYQAAATAATATVRKTDAVSLMGVPEGELTPKVRQAISTLVAEVDRMRDEIETQRQRISYLEQLADQDSMLPVVNRRAFVRELTRIVSYGDRYGAPSSVIYIDLNDLKHINDEFGHAAGDAALLKLSATLTEQVRESDVVGRLGGDEFGILLAHADAQVAGDKAAALTATIEANPLSFGAHTIPLRVAMGIHTFSGGEDPGDALAAADRAMYLQKKTTKKHADKKKAANEA